MEMAIADAVEGKPRASGDDPGPKGDKGDPGE